MDTEARKSTTRHRSETIAVAKDGGPESDDVPPEDRRERTLEFMAEHDIPLPPLAIYGGLIREYRITFAYRTVQNILSELFEDGYIRKVDTTELRERGVFEEIEDGSNRRAFYEITQSGLDRLADE